MCVCVYAYIQKSSGMRIQTCKVDTDGSTEACIFEHMCMARAVSLYGTLCIPEDLVASVEELCRTPGALRCNRRRQAVLHS